MSKFNKIILGFIISLLFYNPQFISQSDQKIINDYNFKKIGIAQGLSQTTILSILQDRRGYMWFGTANGLNRYDGYEFEVYNNKLKDSLSLSDYEITSLFEDAEGFLWIGTAKGMLNKFNPKTETFEYFDIASSSDWFSIEDEKLSNYPLTFSRNQNSSITTIAQDKDGFLWIGTWGKGLLKFHPKTMEKKYFYHFRNRFNSVSSNKIVKIYIDKKNVLWVGTFNGGLNRADSINAKKVKFINFNKYENISKITGEKITTIMEDLQNNLVIGSYDKGISIIEASTKYLNPTKYSVSKLNIGIREFFQDPNIMAVNKDNEYNLWIGTFGNGLIRYNQKTREYKQYLSSEDPNSLSENEIQSIYIDDSEIIWVGTQLGSGINKLESNKNKFNKIPISSARGKSLNDNIIWSIFEDSQKYLWFGTYRGGLNRFDRKNSTFTYYDNKSLVGDVHIRSIIEDFKGNLWIGTFSGGLTLFEGAKNKFTNFKMGESPKQLKSNQIQSLIVEKDTTLWIGTFGGGISKVSLSSFYKNGIVEFSTMVHNPSDIFSISDNRVYCFLITKNDELWIGTHGGGICYYDRNENIFKSYKSDKNNKTSLSDDRVMTIQENKDGNLLIGTFGGGLNLFDRKDKTFKNINQISGMNCNDVYGILEDNKNNYWLSTNDGIYKLATDFQSFAKYDLLDGLQSLEFNGGAYYKAEDGTFYFGGINGINYFDPSDIKINKYDAPIVISKIKLFDQEIYGERENLIFTKDQNYFSFEFASLDFRNSGKNKYKYILEGVDKNWTYTDASNRKVYYTNLNPGKYKFIVNGTNNDGVWSPRNASVEITILAPFWMQWWFIALMILVIGGLITFYINQRIRYLIALDKLKSNLSADLHDNVGAGLTEISILSELTSVDLTSSNASKNLLKISELARHLVESMSDIVWVVNPNRDSLYDLIVRLKDSYAELLGDLGITLQSSDLDKLIDIKLPIEIRQNLYLILKESINNCLKHSKCKNIDLIINKDGKNMIIEINDNGIGFNPKLHRHRNGLNNIENRSKKIGWEFSINSEIDKGTKIYFKGRIK